MARPRDNSYRSDGVHHTTGEVIQDHRAPGTPFALAIKGGHGDLPGQFDIVFAQPAGIPEPYRAAYRLSLQRDDEQFLAELQTMLARCAVADYEDLRAERLVALAKIRAERGLPEPRASRPAG
jgi:hypothetical protein